jgi:tetratricopeptide (TPR) repeat protein
VGNARRVKGDLPSADAAFGRAQRLWSAGRNEDSGLLDEVRLLDLEASLRRAQTRFPEALKLLDRALAIDGGRLKGRLLLNKATVLEALGNIEEAISILYQAAPLIYSEGEPRLVYALQFNLAVNLCFLGQYEKAEASLPQLRIHAAKLITSLDGERLRWLEGRIAAGQGDRKQAITIFSQVQAEFLRCGLVQDGALVSLELAVLYLEAGRTSEVRILARRMAPIFKAQGVHREVLAALKLFRDAAESESVTLELTQRLIDYLHRARYNPELRFQSP